MNTIELSQRHQSIISLLEHEKKISVHKLAEHFSVSPATIRSDLNVLENRSLLKRVHGAAVLNDPDDLDFRIQVNYAVKKSIAEKAVRLIGQQETVFIESGSTNSILAAMTAEITGVTIITSNLHIVNQLRKTEVSVIVMGGLYQPGSETVVGPLTRECLKHIHFSKAFIGIDGFTRHTGFTINDMMRAEISREIISICPDTYILTDSSKFSRIALTPLGNTNNVKGIITDAAIPQEMFKYFDSAGIDVLLSE